MENLNAKLIKAVDGRRLIKVSFVRQAPDSNTPTIEAIFRLYWPEDFTLEGEPFVLFFLSATRTDTRESVELAEHEIKPIMEAAVVRAATEHQEW